MKFGEKIEIVSKKNLVMNNVKYLKSKVTSYYGKINTNFDNSELPKEGSQCIFYQ